MAKEYALQARVTADEHAAFTAMAESVGMTVSEYLRTLVSKAIKEANIDSLREFANIEHEKRLAALDALSNLQLQG